MAAITFAIVQLWTGKAILFWRHVDYLDKPPYEQIDSAFQVIPLDRDDAIILASALYAAYGGRPEEMSLSSRQNAPHEQAPNYPEQFQVFLQMRAAAKEDGRYIPPSLPRFRADRLDYWDRYADLIGMGITPPEPRYHP